MRKEAKHRGNAVTQLIMLETSWWFLVLTLTMGCDCVLLFSICVVVRSEAFLSFHFIVTHSTRRINYWQ